MKIFGMGLDMRGKPIFVPEDESTFAKKLVTSLEANYRAIETLARSTIYAISFRGEVEKEVIDLGDPVAAGWTYLINSIDPKHHDYQEIIKKLASLRGMEDYKKPLLFNNEPPEEWLDWINDNYFALKLDGKKVPRYILIVGGPDQIPFKLQSLLGSVANVGRVEFDNLDDLNQYVKKIIRIEKAKAPVVNREAVLFAPDAGLNDATYFSREYLAKPLGEHIQSDKKISTISIMGRAATKQNLIQTLTTKNPALVFTASHGILTAPNTLDIQKQYNGAICCQKAEYSSDLKMEDWLFTASDIPMTQPFLEGAVFFQFACFGYGTPAVSDYSHWLTGTLEKYTNVDFVAAIPKRLLAHPKGPIAFIGHLDTAFLHGFADVEDPMILDRWHTRIEPFVDAVDQLLGVQPSGLALTDMNSRFSASSIIIASTYDRRKRGKLKWNADAESRFVNTWITRNDAQNYMIFGDPAVKLRIPAEEGVEPLS